MFVHVRATAWLQAALEADLDEAVLDGSLTASLQAGCGCSLAATGTTFAARQEYPTLRPTPAPSPAPTPVPTPPPSPTPPPGRPPPPPCSTCFASL